MQCSLECNYKGIREIPAGSFVNSNGKTINYDKFYKIRFDYMSNNIAVERELKIPSNIALSFEQNYHLKIYDKIVINLNIEILANSRFVAKVISVEKK